MRKVLHISPDVQVVGDFAAGDIRFDHAPPNELDGNLISEADAIVIQNAGLSADQLEQATKCMAIAHAGTGPGGVNIETARRLGIYVTSIPDFATAEYADLTIATFEKHLRSSALEGRPARIGLVGLGQVGRAVALRGLENGYDVWGSDPFVALEVFRVGKIRKAPINELAGICDVLSLHLPLVDATRGMIDFELLDLMKPASFLINTSSPDLIDFPSVRKAFERGTLGGAALTKSPNPQDSFESIGTNFNWLNTSFEKDPKLEVRALRMAREIILNYFKGQPIVHLLIDPPHPRVPV